MIVADITSAIKSFDRLAEEAGFKPSRCNTAVVKPNICGFYPPDINLLKATVMYAGNYAETVYVGDTASTIHSPILLKRGLKAYPFMKN